MRKIILMLLPSDYVTFLDHRPAKLSRLTLEICSMDGHIGVRMSFKESFEVDVCHQVLRGEIPAKLAALKINKSYRQTLRIIDKVRLNRARGGHAAS